jgi:hypothetical protein
VANSDVRERVTAPYSDTPIKLSLLSISTQRYKTYYCLECGYPFLQRDNDTLYRTNSTAEPGRVYMDTDGIMITCGKCSQKYSGMVVVSPPRGPQDEFAAPAMQSIYIVPSEAKQQRYMGCMECGQVFCAITDRISLIVDNVAPLEFMPTGRIGLMEVRCKRQRCGQSWALMVS